MADPAPIRTIIVFGEGELQAAMASSPAIGEVVRRPPATSRPSPETADLMRSIDGSWERHVEHWLRQHSEQPVQMHRMTLEQIEAHLVHRRTAFPALRAHLALLLTRSLRGLLARGDWQ